MNSVHEPCPNGDSGIVLSRKLGRKLSQVHKTPNLAQLGTPRCTQGRPGAHNGRIVALGPAVSWPRPAVWKAPGRRVAARARAPVARPAPAPCRGLAVHCIAIQCPALPLALGHNTLGVLRYNIFSSQAPLLQYTCCPLS